MMQEPGDEQDGSSVPRDVKLILEESGHLYFIYRPTIESGINPYDVKHQWGLTELVEYHTALDASKEIEKAMLDHQKRRNNTKGF